MRVEVAFFLAVALILVTLISGITYYNVTELEVGKEYAKQGLQQQVDPKSYKVIWVSKEVK